MIQTNDLLSLSYYELAPFTGSDKALRYRIEKKETDGSKQLLATAWKTPLAFDYTPDEDKQTKLADFSKEGLADLTDWLNSL